MFWTAQSTFEETFRAYKDVSAPFSRSREAFGFIEVEAEGEKGRRLHPERRGFLSTENEKPARAVKMPVEPLKKGGEDRKKTFHSFSIGKPAVEDGRIKR